MTVSRVKLKPVCLEPQRWMSPNMWGQYVQRAGERKSVLGGGCVHVGKTPPPSKQTT